MENSSEPDLAAPAGDTETGSGNGLEAGTGAEREEILDTDEPEMWSAVVRVFFNRDSFVNRFHKCCE